MKTLRTLLTWGLLSAAAHVMGYSLTVSPIEIEAGQTANLIINLDDAPDNFTAYQMMVYLPDGVTVQKKTNGKYAYTANADRHDGNFTITVKDAADGSVLIACFSADKDVLTGTSGELIRLPLEVASTVTTSLQGSIKNIEFSDVNNNAYNPADVNFTMTLKEPVSQNITFADPAVKALCVANWDTNGDGELSKEEAAAVTNLGGVFDKNSEITSFNELQYFTGLIRIGTWTFRFCSNLTSITIPESVTSIGDYAFIGCEDLISITIPESVTNIGTAPFDGCSGLTSIAVDSENTKYDSRDNCNAIIETSTNTLIAGCKNTVIPNDVTSIGERAFEGCRGLTSITIPESVTSIGKGAFWYCSSLTSVTIPESVTSIGSFAFSDCTGLTSITIGNSVTSIGMDAFNSCRALTSITIPESVTSIGDKSFAGCSGLTSIKVELGNTKYDSRDNCNAIIKTASNTLIAGCINTTIPESVTSIGSDAFYGCRGLTSIIIPESVTSISYQAFYNCRGLTSVTIPNSVTIIGADAFNGTAWYDNQPDGLVYAGKVAYKYKGTMPEGTEIVIKDGTLGITGDAFSGCSGLTSITIPESVTHIGDEAFEDCSGLQSIICYAKDTPWATGGTFRYVDVSNVTLRVPRESVQKYKDHLVWGKFKIEVIDGIEDVRSGESGEDFERSIYDLSGRRLPDGRKSQGIYIRNGKKIAVK